MNTPKIHRRGFLKKSARALLATGSLLSLPGFTKTALAAPMPRRVLGATGARVPILNMGTSQSMDGRYDKLLHRAYKEGVDYLDTALSYGWGSSHAAVANFIDQVGGRKKVWLTSKSSAGSPGGLAKGLDKILEELRVDNIDLFFMHGIDEEEMLEPAFIKAGERMRKSGKTRFFGFSCHDDNVVALLNKAARVGGIDAVMFRYNFRRYGDAALNRAMDAAHKAGIGLIAMKTWGAVPDRDEKVVGFRSKNNTLGQAKLKSVWADERIASICSEMDSVQVVRENTAAAKSPLAISAVENEQLRAIARETAHLACQGCGNVCQPAAGGGLRIADSLRFLSYHEAYGNTHKARRLYREMPAEARNLEGANLAAASAACPQGINIAQRLAHAQKVLGG